MPERKIVLLSEYKPESFAYALNLMENEGWEKDVGISYNPYGTNMIHILHLRRLTSEEAEVIARGQIEEEASAEEVVIDRLSVDLDTVKSRKAAEEEGELTAYQELIKRGYVEEHTTSKLAIMVKKAAREEHPAYKAPEKEKVPEEGPPEEEPPSEEAKDDVIQIKDGTGEVIQELDASPKAVQKAQDQLDAESKDVPDLAEPPSEEPETEEAVEFTFNKDLMGCADCKDDDKCTDRMRQTHWNIMNESQSMECRSLAEKEG